MTHLDLSTNQWAGIWENVQNNVIQYAPVVLALIGRWLYDWQILIAGLASLIAANIWGKAIVKAAKINAQGTRVAYNKNEQKASSKVKPGKVSQVRNRDLRDQIGENKPLVALQDFRARIRVILSNIPCVEHPLSPAQLVLCKDISGFALGDSVVLRREVPARDYLNLQDQLKYLASLDSAATCKFAWQALIATNKCARQLQLALTVATESDSNTTIVDERAIRSGGTISEIQRS